MRELLRIGGMNVYDLLQENFSGEALKGALAFDAVLGTNFGPRSPGTVLTLLYRLAAEAGSGTRGLAQPRGGVGAVSEALAKAAVAAGVTIRPGSPVRRILVEADRAAGVELESGERIAAGTVVSNADPKTTFLQLLGAAHLDTGFVRRVRHLRAVGSPRSCTWPSTARRCSTASRNRAARRLLIAPSQQYLERAYNHSKYGEYSSAPAMEITVPSVNDPALAPAGRHVLSAVVQYVPYELKDGWTRQRDRFIDLCTQLLDAHAPGLKASIVAAELLTPLDIEQEFRISGDIGTTASWPSTSSSWSGRCPAPLSIVRRCRASTSAGRAAIRGRDHGHRRTQRRPPGVGGCLR